MIFVFGYKQFLTYKILLCWVLVALPGSGGSATQPLTGRAGGRAAMKGKGREHEVPLILAQFC